MDILFASSEAHPLIKTGGLADVSASLPRAIKNAGHDIRLIIPAYPSAKAAAGCMKTVARFSLSGTEAPIEILQGRLPGTQVPCYLVDAPEYFDRAGGPYSSPDGHDWPDNAARFTAFCRSIFEIVMNRAGMNWAPDLVHCNDWQTGLVPAFLSTEPNHPPCLFTIHNLAYQGLFNQKEFERLQLPDAWWNLDGVEFHNQLSFIKGGLNFSDWITTVSPTYASEIRTAALGNGLEGLLNHRKHQLDGILNGVDYEIWNPGRDPFIEEQYNTRTIGLKAKNKTALQKRFKLPANRHTPVFGHVGRIVEQKGIDLILDVIPELVKRSAQLIVLGSGNQELEQALLQAQEKHPKNIGVKIGYDEPTAHLLEAGSDIFLMPSRFEPCGLNQMYSLRYGTPPIVRRTGGLADSVVNVSSETLAQRRATGFVFNEANATALLETIDRALDVYAQKDVWSGLLQTAMSRDFSWKKSASIYIDLYTKLLGAVNNTEQKTLHSVV